MNTTHTTRTLAYLVVAAIGMGFLSPFIVSAAGGFLDPSTHQGLFYFWFMSIVAAVDQALLPATNGETLMLAIAVYAGQHLVAFLLLWASTPLARILHDFIGAPRHRSGLPRG
jgi:hypothetical protein